MNNELGKVYRYKPYAIAAAFVGIAIGVAAIANCLGFNSPLILILSPAQPLVMEKQRANGSVSKVVSLLLGGYILGASTTGLKSLLHREKS